MLRKMGLKLERIEDDIFEGRSSEIVRDISEAKQEIINFRKIVRPQRAVLRDLERTKQRYLQEELEIYFDDISDAAERIWDTLENYKEVVEGLESTNESVLSHRLNDSFRILTAASVVLLPLTLIASIFGMNVPFPGEGEPFAFFGILVLMAVLLVASSPTSGGAAGCRTRRSASRWTDDDDGSPRPRSRRPFDRRAVVRGLRRSCSTRTHEAPLGLDDLDVAGSPRDLVGTDEAATRVCAAHHRTALKLRLVARAARMAFWIGMGFLQRGEMAQGGGWLGRSVRLLEEHDLDIVECGYLLIPEGSARSRRRRRRPRSRHSTAPRASPNVRRRRPRDDGAPRSRPVRLIALG